MPYCQKPHTVDLLCHNGTCLCMRGMGGRHHRCYYTGPEWIPTLQGPPPNSPEAQGLGRPPTVVGRRPAPQRSLPGPASAQPRFWPGTQGKPQPLTPAGTKWFFQGSSSQASAKTAQQRPPTASPRRGPASQGSTKLQDSTKTQNENKFCVIDRDGPD